MINEYMNRRDLLKGFTAGITTLALPSVLHGSTTDSTTSLPDFSSKIPAYITSGVGMAFGDFVTRKN
ncbi:MAG: hypothetical protein ACYCSP_14890 [Acidobacteriaceae bacterium]